MDGAHDIAGVDVAAPDTGQHVVDTGARQPRKGGLDRVVRKSPPCPFKGPCHDLAAKADKLGARGFARCPADGGAGLAGGHHALPGSDWRLAFGAGNIDLVAILQFRQQWRDMAVDLGSDRAVADIGMHGICKVNRRGPARQHDQPPFGGEAEDLVMEQFQLGMFQKFFRRIALVEQFDGVAQPVIGAAVLCAADVLVKRMRGNAVDGNVVHVAGAHLQFDALAARTDHSRMQRAIIILLGRRNIILETSRHIRPFHVDNANHAVAILAGIDQHPKSVNIRQLLEGNRLALHFAPDRIGMLLPSAHVSLDTAGGKFIGQFLFDLGDQRAVPVAQIRQPCGNGGAGFWHQVAKSQILQFIAHALHAHAPGQRRVDVQRFLGNARLLVLRHKMQCAHIVQPVGELDQQHAHIIGNGQQKLAEILGLGGTLGHQVEPLQLGQALDQSADFATEQLVDFLACRRGVFDRVMQHGGNNRRVVEFQIGQNGRHFQRMRKIRIARRALLRAMGFHRIDIGAIQKVFVGLRVIAPHAFNEVHLPNHVAHRLLGVRQRHVPPARLSGALQQTASSILQPPIRRRHRSRRAAPGLQGRATDLPPSCGRTALRRWRKLAAHRQPGPGPALSRLRARQPRHSFAGNG